MEYEIEDKKGKYIIALLGLRLTQKPDSSARIDTQWGDKTPMGLYNSLKRVIETPVEELPEILID